MAIEQLEISNFRNLKKVSLTPSPHINALFGDNGSGKTSLLEAIYFLGTARSFRTPHSKQAIMFGQPQFVVFAKIVAEGGASVPVGVSKDPQSITIKIANRPVNNSSALAELLPVQLINPDVHKMLEEGPRYRRRFLEWGLFHVKPNYFQHWQECRHILKQRNAALKQNLSGREIDQWNRALCEKSELINRQREEYLQALQPVITELLDRSPQLPKVEITLSKGWPKNKTLEQALTENLETDRSRGFTQHGPHRADLSITCQGIKAKDVVSRGQQKIITAIMKLAQLQLLTETKSPSRSVLLVDDLPAELDPKFRELLLSIVRDQRAQVFVTATETSLLQPQSATSDLRMFHVEHGQVGQQS